MLLESMSGSNKEHILVSAFLSLDHGEWNDLCAIKKNDFGNNERQSVCYYV